MNKGPRPSIILFLWLLFVYIHERRNQMQIVNHSEWRNQIVYHSRTTFAKFETATHMILEIATHTILTENRKGQRFSASTRIQLQYDLRGFDKVDHQIRELLQ
jgi:hypothetical protein